MGICNVRAPVHWNFRSTCTSLGELPSSQRPFEKSRIGHKVPSQSGNGSYVVNTDVDPLCTCPDFEKRQQPCNHIYAVEFTIRREGRPDGTTVETKSVKVTYGQDWAAYNAAQTFEKDTFMVLLADLCAGVPPT